MQENLMKCISFLSQCASRDEEALRGILDDIHKSVFRINETNEGLLTPLDLLSSCEAAVSLVGGSLSKRKRSAMMQLPIGVVVVELIARLTRILFWEKGASAKSAMQCGSLKNIEEDAEQLEAFLLPRFFLKLPVSPATLRDVLLKAPWKLFSEKYGARTAPHCKAAEPMPAEVATALGGLKKNFGCDFLHNCTVYVALPQSVCFTPLCSNVEAPNSATTSAPMESTTAANNSGAISGVTVSIVEDGVSTGVSTCPPGAFGGHCAHKPLPKPRNTLRTAAGQRAVWRTGDVTPVNRTISPLSLHSTRSLPPYMLRRRRSGTMPPKIVQHGSVGVTFSEQGSNPVALDTRPSANDDRDAEVLATESPVRKRVRADGVVVPPSPSRLTRQLDFNNPIVENM